MVHICHKQKLVQNLVSVSQFTNSLHVQGPVLMYRSVTFLHDNLLGQPCCLLSVIRGCQQHAAISVRLHSEYAPCCGDKAPFNMASCPLIYVKFVYIECEHGTLSMPCLLLDNLKILRLARLYTLRFSACPYFDLSRRAACGACV